MEHRFVRVTHGVEADLNEALAAMADQGWQLKDAFAAAGDVVLLFERATAKQPAAAEGAAA